MRRRDIANYRTTASMTLVFSMLVLQAAPEKPAITNTKNGATPEKSVFIMPTDPAQGRDPFFPNSLRPYEDAAPTKKIGNVSALEIKGFVGTGNMRMAIINNHTFAVGDEGDVLTDQGRMHIRCVQIKGNNVTIEVDGQIHELIYHDNL